MVALGVPRQIAGDMRGFLTAAERPSVSVVIPTLNEAANIAHVLARIPVWIDEIILVDGDSVDDTVAIARGIIPDLVIVNQDRPGKGAALRCGFLAARGEIIVTFDADGSMDPNEIPAFVGALLTGADFVKGSRFMQGGGTDDMEWYRRLGNWGFVKLVRWGIGGRFTDLCYGYNAFWSDILDHVDLEQCDGFEVETALNLQVLRGRFRIHEVPSHEAARLHGCSHLKTIPDGWRVLKTIMRLGLNRPRLERGSPKRTSVGRRSIPGGLVRERGDGAQTGG